jgi:TusA-related sulfurtransferase
MAMSDISGTTSSSAPAPHADAILDAAETGCATLTPLIRGRIRALESGQILEVRTDDPTAQDSLLSWCALTGHSLVAAVADQAQGKQYFIRKK